MSALLLIAGCAVLLLAGLVKGVIGMGLPTVGVGLLSVVTSPAQAAAVLILPSAVTNVVQYVTGPNVRPILARFATMMIGVAAGTLIGGFSLGGLSSPLAQPALGATLAIYGLMGLSSLKLEVPARHEAWLSPLMGLLTGLVTATTGVSVMPSEPYLQALGLPRDDLVQALGLTFTVSTFALAATLAAPGGDGVLWSNPALLIASFAALVPAFIGMEAGRRVRLAISPQVFRKVFFAGLLVLGAYMMARAVL